MREMNFDDIFHFFGIYMTFGAIVPLEEMMSPFIVLYTHTCWILRGCFGVLALYFYFEAILGVGLRPIHLVSWIIIILGAFREMRMLGLSHIYRGWFPHL
jgi:hypothetical protein